MQSGKLRKRFTVQTYSGTLNDYGEMEASWTTFSTIWGSLNATKGDEIELADKVIADTTYDIKIRFLSGLLPKMRFKLGTRYFNIIKILPDRTDARFQIVQVGEKMD